MAPGVVRDRRFDLTLLGAWILAISLAAAGRVSDTDPYWQIRAGQEVLAGTPLVRPDTWSWAPTGGLFYPNSPAWNVLLASAWNAVGAWGLFLATVCSIAACLALVAHLALRLGARPLPTVPVIIAVSAVALPVLSPRAALVSEAILLGSVAAAEWWSRRAARHGPWASLAFALAAGTAFSLVGNWTHLSWSSLAGLAAATWTVLWLLASGIPRRTRAVLIVAGTLGLAAGVALGPYGVDGWERAAAVYTACQGIVIEWAGAFKAELGARWWPAGIALTGGTVAAAAWCVGSLRREGRGDPRLALVAALTVGAMPLAVGGFVAIRFIPAAMLTFAPVVAAAFTTLALRTSRRVRSRSGPSTRLGGRAEEWTSLAYWRVILAATLVVLAPAVAVIAWPHAQPQTGGINRLLPPGCRLFSTSIEAAAVILERPDVTVWLDGRSEYWGRDRLLRARKYFYEPSDGELAPPGATCILLTDPGLEPGLAALTTMLDASPAWVHVAGQEGANLWLPADPPAAPLS